MRGNILVLVTLAAACGDNIHPALFVETQVASHSLVAGDQVGARCSVVDAHGNAALDPRTGNPLDDTTDFTISYEDPDSFATDGDGNVIAAKVGTATVRCAAPSLALVDRDPETVTIVAGPPVRAITRLDRPTDARRPGRRRR